MTPGRSPGEIRLRGGANFVSEVTGDDVESSEAKERIHVFYLDLFNIIISYI